MKKLKQNVTDLKTELSAVKGQLERFSVQESLLTKYSDGLFSAGSEAHTCDLLDDSTIGKYSWLY